MTETEPAPNGNGEPDPAADPPAKTTIESAIDGIKLIFSKELEQVGLIVFTITSIALIIFVILFNWNPPDREADYYRQLRSTELLLTLAATGLVVAIIARGQNVFVMVLGIFLIGALIVPSKDIVRFALIASGSDKDYESFFRSTQSGTDVKGRNSDVANKILNDLDSRGFILHLPNETDDANIRAARRKEASQIIEDGVREERIITLLEQVRARGAFRTLRAAPTDFKGWVYKYGREEKFIEDLRFLRAEGLINYAYDDLDTVAVTPLGYATLAMADGAPLRQPGPDIYPEDLPGGFPLAAEQLACNTGTGDVPDLSTELLSTEGYPIAIESGFQYIRFTAPDADTYRIDVVGDDPGLVGVIDPYMTLAALPPDGDCTYLRDDDDGGDGLNARITHALTKQSYLIGVGNLSGVTGQARVSIAKENTFDIEQNPGLFGRLRRN
jgi:hypothetical protein